MNKEKTLLKRITELETKVAFQEVTIDELNQMIVHHQLALDKMQIQIRYFADKLSGMQPSNIASQAEETPPPHY